MKVAGKLSAENHAYFSRDFLLTKGNEFQKQSTPRCFAALREGDFLEKRKREGGRERGLQRSTFEAKREKVCRS